MSNSNEEAEDSLSREEKDRQLVDQVEALRKEGLNVEAACKKIGRHFTSYYEAKQRLGIPSRSYKKTGENYTETNIRKTKQVLAWIEEGMSTRAAIAKAHVSAGTYYNTKRFLETGEGAPTHHYVAQAKRAKLSAQGILKIAQGRPVWQHDYTANDRPEDVTRPMAEATDRFCCPNCGSKLELSRTATGTKVSAELNK